MVIRIQYVIGTKGVNIGEQIAVFVYKKEDVAAFGGCAGAGSKAKPISDAPK